MYKCSWANSGPKNTKRQKTQLPFLKSQEQKKMGIWEQKEGLHMPTAPNTTKVVGKPPK